MRAALCTASASTAASGTTLCSTSAYVAASDTAPAFTSAPAFASAPGTAHCDSASHIAVIIFFLNFSGRYRCIYKLIVSLRYHKTSRNFIILNINLRISSV